jgi:hypothetical protein
VTRDFSLRGVNLTGDGNFTWMCRREIAPSKLARHSEPQSDDHWLGLITKWAVHFLQKLRQLGDVERNPSCFIARRASNTLGRFVLQLRGISLGRHGILCATLSFFLTAPIASNPNVRFKSHADKHKNQRGGSNDDNERETEPGWSCTGRDRDICMDRFVGGRPI